MPLKLTTTQRKYVKKHATYREPDASELDEELNIVPFLDIVVNLIMFLLMVISSVAFFSQLEASLPSYGRGVGRRSDTRPQLNLSVTLLGTGLNVSGASGQLAPGCETTGPPGVITVPKRGNDYDWAALGQCLRKVKAEFQDETRVTIIGGMDTLEFQHIVSAMDAARGTDEEELFPDILLAAGVR